MPRRAVYLAMTIHEHDFSAPGNSAVTARHPKSEYFLLCEGAGTMTQAPLGPAGAPIALLAPAPVNSFEASTILEEPLLLGRELFYFLAVPPKN